MVAVCSFTWQFTETVNFVKFIITLSKFIFVQLLIFVLVFIQFGNIFFSSYLVLVHEYPFSGAVLAKKIWGAWPPCHGERGSASLSRGSGGFAPSGGPGGRAPGVGSGGLRPLKLTTF